MQPRQLQLPKHRPPRLHQSLHQHRLLCLPQLLQPNLSQCLRPLMLLRQHLHQPRRRRHLYHPLLQPQMQPQARRRPWLLTHLSRAPRVSCSLCQWP